MNIYCFPDVKLNFFSSRCSPLSHLRNLALVKDLFLWKTSPICAFQLFGAKVLVWFWPRDRAASWTAWCHHGNQVWQWDSMANKHAVWEHSRLRPSGRGRAPGTTVCLQEAERASWASIRIFLLMACQKLMESQTHTFEIQQILLPENCFVSF